jgi:hypothetical protein
MVEARTDEKQVFARGEKLWWKTTGYGHKRRIPVTVLEMSASGKRVLVKFPTRDYFGAYHGEMMSYVSLPKLEPRHE